MTPTPPVWVRVHVCQGINSIHAPTTRLNILQSSQHCKPPLQYSGPGGSHPGGGWGNLRPGGGGGVTDVTRRGGGVWETDICDRTHVRSQLTVFVLAYFGRPNYLSPHVFILKMHRVLWRIRVCMPSMKKTVDLHFPPSSGSPIGRIHDTFLQIFTALVFSASR